ncbi:F-box only protein 50-like [Pholidichthys leucotaenia]
MTSAEWKKRCEEEWSLQGAPMPDSLDWKSVYEAKPLGRNLLKNPSPHGLSKDTEPPEPELPEFPDHGPTHFLPDDDAVLLTSSSNDLQVLLNEIADISGSNELSPYRYLTHHITHLLILSDFTGWTTDVEVLPYDRGNIPEGVVICVLSQYSWFTMEQIVDLKAEGLWEELLDEFQPEIVIQDWYEESQLHKNIYQLNVKLLGADKSTVISEHSVSPTEDCSVYSHSWKEVSHVFSRYGHGVRYIHFLHRVKNSFLNGFHQTRVTGSSVTVQPVKSSA